MKPRIKKKRCTEDRSGTAKVADFAAETTFEDIPREAIKASKDTLLDWIGVAIAGSREPGVRIISEYVKRFGAQNEASVICQGFKTVPEMAALVNGTIGHALDFDDTFPNSVHYNIHPSTSVFPPVLALAEQQKLTGRELLTAYIIGMEVHYRLGTAFGQSVPNSGWHSTPVMGTIAATAASANALGLGFTETGNAIGIAASLSGGLMRNIGTMTKPMHAGNGARNGILAASLAAQGFTGNNTILDQEWGFCHVFSGRQVNGLMGAEMDLGKDWNLASVGIGFKPYPSCRSTHASIDATLFLRKEYGISPDDVAEITCKISPIHTQFCRFFKPKTGYEGKFSINYCVAMALRNGKILLEDFTNDKVSDPEIQDLAAKVKFVYPDGWGKGAVDLAAEISITLKNGTQRSHRISFPKGEPENPMTDKELDAKFANCSQIVLDKKTILKALSLIRHLDETDDLTPLFTILGKSGIEN